MIQRLDELRRLLGKQTVSCPDGYHALSVRDDTLPCPTCCGSGRIPDPKWVPMLRILQPVHFEILGDMTAQEHWDGESEGALAGAIAEASVEVEDIQVIIAAWGQWFLADEGTNQAAVDWCIARLKERNG